MKTEVRQNTKNDLGIRLSPLILDSKLKRRLAAGILVLSAIGSTIAIYINPDMIRSWFGM